MKTYLPELARLARRAEGQGARACVAFNAARSHLKDEWMGGLKEAGVTPVVLPGGTTGDLQPLDTGFFAVFKRCYSEVAAKYADAELEKDASKRQKLTSSCRRVLLTKFTADALDAALKKVNLASEFKRLGYTREFDCIQLGRLPDYSYGAEKATRKASQAAGETNAAKQVTAKKTKESAKRKAEAELHPPAKRQRTIDTFFKKL